MTNPNPFDGMGEELSGVAREIIQTQMELYKKYLGEKVKSLNVMNYNGANLAYNHARDVAAKLGLDSNEINPYPGKNQTVVVSDSQQAAPQTDPKKRSLPTWASLLLGVGLGGATLGGGAIAMPVIASWIANQADKPQVQAPAEKPDPEPHKPGEVGITIE